MKKWMLYAKKADFNAISKKFYIDPVVARIIRNRDIIEEEQIRLFLNGNISDLHEPRLMKDVEKAALILDDKINNKKRIRIISDYDVDGVMSGYILYQSLKALGAIVDYKIPDRIEDGYGINEKLIREARNNDIDTIVTCDNGIAARTQIALCKNLGMTIIITDHHDVPFEDINGERHYMMPPADAIIDPKQTDCPYPYKNLCGACVAWKLMIALYEMTKQDTKVLYNLLPFVAIATVCDVVDLLDENRIIVKKGLELLNNTNHFGIKALIDINELSQNNLSTYHLGFVIGPCINATGRLDSSELSMKLLLSDSYEEAYEFARKLKELNEIRKDMTRQYTDKAISLLENKQLPKVIVVYMPDCHESLAGIIAGRIREKFYRPVYVITKSAEGLKGSGRSIEGYHMFEELSKCKNLLIKYGGHPMAAGFSLEEQYLYRLEQRLLDNCPLSDEEFVEKTYIDVPVPLDYLSVDLVKQLEILEPYGKANPKPLFAEKELRIRGLRIMGASHNVCKLTLENKKGAIVTAMLFRDIPDDIHKYQWIDCIYYPNLNIYQGYTNLQIIIQDYRLY